MSTDKTPVQSRFQVFYETLLDLNEVIAVDIAKTPERKNSHLLVAHLKSGHVIPIGCRGWAEVDKDQDELVALLRLNESKKPNFTKPVKSVDRYLQAFQTVLDVTQIAAIDLSVGQHTVANQLTVYFKNGTKLVLAYYNRKILDKDMDDMLAYLRKYEQYRLYRKWKRTSLKQKE